VENVCAAHLIPILWHIVATLKHAYATIEMFLSMAFTKLFVV